MSTAAWLTTSDTISSTSWSRPKNRARSASVGPNGRGPTYGCSSGSAAIVAEVVPALAELACEVPGVAPVQAHLDRLDLLEIAVQVLLRAPPPFFRIVGLRGVELHGDAGRAQRAAERAHQPAEENAEV